MRECISSSFNIFSSAETNLHFLWIIFVRKYASSSCVRSANQLNIADRLINQNGSKDEKVLIYFVDDVICLENFVLLCRFLLSGRFL